MDRISCIAYLLYQVNNEELKNASIRLVNGDVSLTKLKKDCNILPYIQEAEKTLKEQTLNNEDVYKFVEHFLYVNVD